MDFIVWWFEYHWILSTVLTPWWSLGYAIWGHQPGMVAFAMIIILFRGLLRLGIEWLKANK